MYVRSKKLVDFCVNATAYRVMLNTTHCVERYINSQYLISSIELLENRSIQSYEWISKINGQQEGGRHCTMEMDHQLNHTFYSFR